MTDELDVLSEWARKSTPPPLAEFLLQTMLPDIDEYTERYRLMLDGDVLVNRVFENDLDAASVAWLQMMKPAVDSMNYSLFFSRLHTAHLDRLRARANQRLPLFPSARDAHAPPTQPLVRPVRVPAAEQQPDGR